MRMRIRNRMISFSFDFLACFQGGKKRCHKGKIHLCGNVCPLWHVCAMLTYSSSANFKLFKHFAPAAGSSVNKLSLSPVFCSLFFGSVYAPTRAICPSNQNCQLLGCVIKNRSLHADHLFMHAPKSTFNLLLPLTRFWLASRPKPKQRDSKIKPKANLFSGQPVTIRLHFASAPHFFVLALIFCSFSCVASTSDNMCHWH